MYNRPQRFSSNRNSQGRSRFSTPNRNNRRPRSLDPSLFVRKAIHKEEEVYVSKHTFLDFQVNDQLKRNIQARGYTTPTPIQDQAIPEVLSGRDVVGIANTGTGKTAAFLIPLINKVFLNSTQKAIIITPTRELAAQIEDELKEFSRNMRLFSVLVIGGVGMSNQIYWLKKKPHFVIGTPGRLKDLERQGFLKLNEYPNIVLDEVDHMLDMGFINDVRYLTSKLPQQRQSLFFSATMPHEVVSLMHSFMRDPVTVSVKKGDTAANVDQDIVRTNGKLKIDVLYDLLKQQNFDKVLIFSRTKWGIDKLAKSLEQRGMRVAAIHGNKSQSQRQRALNMFKQNKINVLLATDVASRGLDIDNVSHVINFDAPENYEDYVHRIGRTGRANKKGIALTFVD